MKYEEPNMQILLLQMDDVVTTSPGLVTGGNTDYGDWPF